MVPVIRQVILEPQNQTSYCGFQVIPWFFFLFWCAKIRRQWPLKLPIFTILRHDCHKSRRNESYEDIGSIGRLPFV